jgi:hypothetical protein
MACANTGGTMNYVTVYRANGTLAQQQWNYDGRPNAPGRWMTYEADGKTPSVEVQTRDGFVRDGVLSMILPFTWSVSPG